jgi:hypothetical protein
MRAELRQLDSVDAPDGMDAFRPDDPRDFLLVVTAQIGPAGQEGGDNFNFLVVGPHWFGANPPGKGFRWARHYIVVDVWDPKVVRRAIEDLCQRATGATWEEIASKLSRFGKWEFEDYIQRPRTPDLN